MPRVDLSTALQRPTVQSINADIEKQKIKIAKLSNLTSDQLKENFIDLCISNAFSHATNHVSVNFERLIDVTNKLQIPDSAKGFDFAPNMTPEASNRTKPINPERVLFDLAMNVANQAGFIYTGPDGKAKKWEIKGSGARAFNDLFLELYKKQLLPGLSDSKIKSAQDIDRLLAPELIQANGEVTPFKEDRLTVFREFANPNAWDKLTEILKAARQSDGSYIFDFKSIYDIARAFPASFGLDPFYKKAALLPILFANNANTRGHNVIVNGIVASDYRLPQTSHNVGELEFSDELVDRLEREEIMSPDDLMVQQMRAVSVYVRDLASKYSGTPINQQDAAFWGAMKDGSLKELQDETLKKAQAQGKRIATKHMLVPTFNF